MTTNDFQRSNDDCADAEQLILRHGLDASFDNVLVTTLAWLDESSYGKTSSVDTGMMSRRTDGLQMLDLISRIGEAALLLRQESDGLFEGSMELAVADAFGVERASEVASAVETLAHITDRDLPLAMSNQLAHFLVRPLIDFWVVAGGLQRISSAALFVRDALKDRWYMPDRFMWAALYNIADELAWKGEPEEANPLYEG